VPELELAAVLGPERVLRLALQQVLGRLLLELEPVRLPLGQALLPELLGRRAAHHCSGP
jgi:hypothetical protein